MLKLDSGIEWEMSIAHLIPWTPFATTIGNSSLEGAGGFLIALGFWWHVPFPNEIIHFTLLFKSDNKDGLLVLIDVLKFVSVIINYCTGLHVFRISNVTDDSTRYYWVLPTMLPHYPGKRSRIGCLLIHFFYSLLINSPTGINSQWISTANNKIADNISCLKKHSDTNSAPNPDYTTLKQTYLELNHCSFFQIQPELILMTWVIVSTKKW